MYRCGVCGNVVEQTYPDFKEHPDKRWVHARIEYTNAFENDADHEVIPIYEP